VLQRGRLQRGGLADDLHLGQEALPVGGELVGHGPERGPQRCERGLARRPGRDELEDGGLLVLVVAREHLLLGRVVAEEGAAGDVTGRRDLVDRRGIEALGGEQVQRRVLEGLARLGLLALAQSRVAHPFTSSSFRADCHVAKLGTA